MRQSNLFVHFIKTLKFFARSFGTRHCWFIIGGLASRSLRSCSIFWQTKTGWKVLLILWLKSLSCKRAISAEAWSLNGRTTRIGSDRSLTVGEAETGWSEVWRQQTVKWKSWQVCQDIVVEKTIISVDQILQRSSANWMKVEMHDQASFLIIHICTGHLHNSCSVAGGQYLWV